MNYLETNEQAEFERVLSAKRDLKAFHMECPVTKKLICRCKYSNTPLEQLERQLNRNQDTKRQKTEHSLPFDIAYDMHLYYQGYQNPSEFLNEQNRQRQQEKERMLNITNKDYLKPFDGFVDGVDADEHARENAFLDLDNMNTIIKKKG